MLFNLLLQLLGLLSPASHSGLYKVAIIKCFLKWKNKIRILIQTKNSSKSTISYLNCLDKSQEEGKW